MESSSCICLVLVSCGQRNGHPSISSAYGTNCQCLLSYLNALRREKGKKETSSLPEPAPVLPRERNVT